MNPWAYRRDQEFLRQKARAENWDATERRSGKGDDSQGYRQQHTDHTSLMVLHQTCKPTRSPSKLLLCNYIFRVITRIGNLLCRRPTRPSVILKGGIFFIISEKFFSHGWQQYCVECSIYWKRSIKS